MDRLSPVAALAAAALALACTGGDETAPTGRERVNAVKARPAAAVELEAFCDVLSPPGQGPPLVLPPLAAAAPDSTAGWRWINLWATWCKPCIEELPRMQAWLPRLRAAGAAVTLQLISADTADEPVAEFRAAHPATPPSLRLRDPEAIDPWLAELGLKGGASIPVHLFVEPSGAVRCIRVAGVEDGDFDAVARLLGGG